MPIYDQPVRVLIRDMIAALAPQKGIFFSRNNAIEWFAKNYPDCRDALAAHFSIGRQSK